MAQRIILGKRGSQTGLWVSKPGKSANSSSISDFLISTGTTNLQPVMAGVIQTPTLTLNSDLTSKGTESDGYGYSDTGDASAASAAGGYAVYTKDFTHNLGYTPVCFFSIGSAVAGEIYPTIQITKTTIRLYHRENWGVGSSTYNDYNSTANYRKGSQTPYYFYSIFYLLASKPSSISYSCNIHYTLYAQSTGL